MNENNTHMIIIILFSILFNDQDGLIFSHIKYNPTKIL